jgi:hypothetical protein
MDLIIWMAGAKATARTDASYLLPAFCVIGRSKRVLRLKCGGALGLGEEVKSDAISAVGKYVLSFRSKPRETLRKLLKIRPGSEQYATTCCSLQSWSNLEPSYECGTHVLQVKEHICHRDADFASVGPEQKSSTNLRENVGTNKDAQRHGCWPK